MALWDGIRWLHLVAMAFFVGGQLMLGAIVVPALRGGDRDRLRAVARRFGYGTLGAIAVLAATGAAQAGHYHRWGDHTLHAKLGLVVVAAVLIAVHIRRPALRVLDGLILVVSLAIVWLGVAIAH